MTDTHTHLYLQEFENGGVDVLSRALDSGVSMMMLPNVDASTLEPMKSLHQKFPDSTWMAAGLHPTEVDYDWEKVVDIMEKEIKSGSYQAVGEIGIDLYWDKSKIDLQKEAFKRQIRLADKYRLPVIIHCREALEETLECIKDTSPKVPLIFHSFTGSEEDVKKIRNVADPYFGINGVVTYKNAQPLRDSLKEIGENRLLLETDSPYLTPVPHRGKRNESSYIHYICEKVAEVLEKDPKDLEHITDENAKALFHK